MATPNNKNLKGQLAKTNETAVGEAKKPTTITEWINAMKPEIEKALPKHLSVDRIARIALTALNTNPKLGECTPKSFIAALMTSAQLGLEPNTPLGQAYLIPYWNGKKKQNEAQFQLGYKGLLDLAYRTGDFQAIYAHEVCENDFMEWEYGLNKDLKHKPAMTNRGAVIGYYAVYRLKNSGYDFVFMSTEAVKEHSKKYSQSVRNNVSSPWDSDFDAMAKKTVLKAVLKYAPLSIEIRQQLEQDETVKVEISEDMTEVPAENISYSIGEEESPNEVNDKQYEGTPFEKDSEE